MNSIEIAKKYVYGNHDALTDKQEIEYLSSDIQKYAQNYNTHKSKELRPFSQLIEEIEHEGEKFIPLNELFKISRIGFSCLVTDKHCVNFECEKDKHCVKKDEYVMSIDIISSGNNEFMFGFSTHDLSFYSRYHNRSKVVFTLRTDDVANQFKLFKKLHEWGFVDFNL